MLVYIARWRHHRLLRHGRLPCAGGAVVTVNWDYITGLVAHAGLQVRDTGLNEVAELQPGERLRFSAGNLQRSIQWNPIDIARNAPFESADEAVVALRATTVGCIHTWAACYSGILHSLSGGLDSSIVLSCLNTAPSLPQLTCLNYFTAGPHEDERRYARLMARHAGVELVECDPDAGEVRLKRSSRCGPRRGPGFMCTSSSRGALNIGLPGSVVPTLCSPAPAAIVCSTRRGPILRSPTTFWITECVGGCSPPRWMQPGCRANRSGTCSSRRCGTACIPRVGPIAMAKPLARTLVTPGVVATAKANPELKSTLADGGGGTWCPPPGILWHIMSLSMPPAYYSSFLRSGYPERTMPLLSQPLVELCLRIPTYLLIRSGRDRALARRAFAGDLPAEIIGRYAKGRANRHYRNIMGCQPAVCPRAHAGWPAGAARAVESHRAGVLILSRGSSSSAFEYIEILNEHVCTEAWLRSWLTSSSSPRE